MLELIVVAGILSVLLGVGVGFLRRSDGMAEVRSAIGGALRIAALDARSRALPTEVLLRPGEDGAPAEVVARGLDPVVLVTFEPGQTQAIAGLEPQLGGEEVPSGRCGRARGPSKQGPAQTPALRLPFGPGVADLRDGFAIRFDLRLHARREGHLLRVGRSIDVHLDELARLRARVQAQGADGRGTAAVNLAAAAGLPIGRWCTIEIGQDGNKVWLTVDGRELAQQQLEATVLQQKDDVLELLPADAGLDAAVDEVQVFAYTFTPAQRLPSSVVLEAPARIAFDVQGEPIAPPDIRLELLSDHRHEVLRIGVGGVLQ